MSIDLRSAVPGDVPALLAFWAEATDASSTDTEAALTALIGHDPGALVLAEQSGSIVGSVMAGWDGWRGCVYRLAVAPSCRRRGLGRRLVREAEDRLRARGAVRLHATVVGTDPQALGFWRGTDWAQAPGQVRFTKG